MDVIAGRAHVGWFRRGRGGQRRIPFETGKSPVLVSRFGVGGDQAHQFRELFGEATAVFVDRHRFAGPRPGLIFREHQCRRQVSLGAEFRVPLQVRLQQPGLSPPPGDV